MSLAFQRLQDTGSALRSALASQDWATIGELDLQCRQAVDEAMVESVVESEETLRLRMQELLDLYRELVTVCQAEQQRLAQEMRQLNQSQQGAKVYQLFG
jgi:flagellar protein FliT